MTAIAVPLLLSLLAAEGEVTVAAPSEPVSIERREEPRLRAAIGGGGAAGVASWGFGFGPALTGELGVVLRDHLGFTARATFGTVFLVMVASAGIGFDYALSDVVSLGAGAALALVSGLFATDQASGTAITVPLRLNVAPFPRGSGEVGRRGLLLTAEVAPGYAFAGSPGFRPGVTGPTPRFAITGMLSVSYAVW